jgi:hypothetical protein
MKRRLLLATTALFLGSFDAAPAVQLRQMTLAEQVADADVVVIARTTSVVREHQREWANLAVEVALKESLRTTLSFYCSPDSLRLRRTAARSANGTCCCLYGCEMGNMCQ